MLFRKSKNSPDRDPRTDLVSWSALFVLNLMLLVIGVGIFKHGFLIPSIEDILFPHPGPQSYWLTPFQAKLTGTIIITVEVFFLTLCARGLIRAITLKYKSED